MRRPDNKDSTRIEITDDFVLEQTPLHIYVVLPWNRQLLCSNDAFLRALPRLPLVAAPLA